MKIFLTMALLTTSFGAFAEDDSKKNVCYYNNIEYSAGSIVSMEGILRECRNGAHEHELWKKENEEYMHVPLGESPLEWRKPILNDQSKVRR